MFAGAGEGDTGTSRGWPGLAPLFFWGFALSRLPGAAARRDVLARDAGEVRAPLAGTLRLAEGLLAAFFAGRAGPAFGRVRPAFTELRLVEAAEPRGFEERGFIK